MVKDALGTPRIMPDQTGSLAGMKRRDFLPFGDELLAGVGIRTTALGFGASSDTTRQKFTGQERDLETGLDYFIARYYSGAQGRFTSPDEFSGGPTELFAEVAAHNPTFYAELAAPQSLNKYQYCLNNPLRFVDPDGHQETLADRVENGVATAVAAIANYHIGVAKAWDNIRIGIGNLGAKTRSGDVQYTEPHAPSNTAQELGMIVVERVTLFGGLLTGGSAAARAGMVAAEAQQTTTVAAGVANAGRSASGSAGGSVSPSFLGQANGPAITIPKGATQGPVVNPAGKVTGFQYTGPGGGNGLDRRVTTVRIMDPTKPKGASPGYPNGYVAYQNADKQGVHPYTGRTIPNSHPMRHIPLCEK